MSSKRRASTELEGDMERKRTKTVEAAVSSEGASGQQTNDPERTSEETKEPLSTGELSKDDTADEISLQAPDAEGNLRPSKPDPDLRKLIPDLSQPSVSGLVLKDFDHCVPDFHPQWNHAPRTFNLS